MRAHHLPSIRLAAIIG